jgi:hypothetical protein
MPTKKKTVTKRKPTTKRAPKRAPKKRGGMINPFNKKSLGFSDPEFRAEYRRLHPAVMFNGRFLSDM